MSSRAPASPLVFSNEMPHRARSSATIGMFARHWWTAIVGGSVLLLAAILLIARILISAAFLSGVYGAFGKAAASGMMLAVALVIEFVAFLPSLQLKWSLTRSGRRSFGLLPAIPAMKVAR